MCTPIHSTLKQNKKRNFMQKSPHISQISTLLFLCKIFIDSSVSFKLSSIWIREKLKEFEWINKFLINTSLRVRLVFIKTKHHAFSANEPVVSFCPLYFFLLSNYWSINMEILWIFYVIPGISFLMQEWLVILSQANIVKHTTKSV